MSPRRARAETALASSPGAPAEPRAATEPRRSRGRPPTIAAEKLLDVAREVFLELGVRATTLEVAGRAGVSEGAIFHRYKTKEALFRAAMRFDEEDFPRLLSGALEKMQGLELDDALFQLASSILEIGKVALPLMMMAWSNPGRSDGELPLHKNRLHYRKVFQQFAVYCEAQMEAGKLRPLDAEIFARAFIGSLHNYCMARLLADEPAVPEGMYVRGLIDLFLRGALPLSPDIRSPKRARP
jgi:AcrR family transcriptional regulator